MIKVFRGDLQYFRYILGNYINEKTLIVEQDPIVRNQESYVGMFKKLIINQIQSMCA